MKYLPSVRPSFLRPLWTFSSVTFGSAFGPEECRRPPPPPWVSDIGPDFGTLSLASCGPAFLSLSFDMVRQRQSNRGRRRRRSPLVFASVFPSRWTAARAREQRRPRPARRFWSYLASFYVAGTTRVRSLRTGGRPTASARVRIAISHEFRSRAACVARGDH